MDEDIRLSIAVESILYEHTAEAMVTLISEGMAAGYSRELLLYRYSVMLSTALDTPEKIASVAVIALVMLTEERRKNERLRGVPEHVDPGTAG